MSHDHPTDESRDAALYERLLTDLIRHTRDNDNASLKNTLHDFKNYLIREATRQRSALRIAYMRTIAISGIVGSLAGIIIFLSLLFVHYMHWMP